MEAVIVVASMTGLAADQGEGARRGRDAGPLSLLGFQDTSTLRVARLSVAQRALPARWRWRLTYAAMSLLVIWHTLAMTVGPFPESDLTSSVRRLLGPYLTVFMLDNQWSFFAPDVGADGEFQYIVEDAAGRRQLFVPPRELNEARLTWVRDWKSYTSVMESPEIYADATGAFLCREHASLHPARITLLMIEPKNFWPADQLAGKQRFGPEFVDESTIKTVTCPDR